MKHRNSAVYNSTILTLHTPILTKMFIFKANICMKTTSNTIQNSLNVVFFFHKFIGFDVHLLICMNIELLLSMYFFLLMNGNEIWRVLIVSCIHTVCERDILWISPPPSTIVVHFPPPPFLPVRLFPILSFSPWKPNFYFLFNSFKVTFDFLFIHCHIAIANFSVE